MSYTVVTVYDATGKFLTILLKSMLHKFCNSTLAEVTLGTRFSSSVKMSESIEYSTVLEVDEVDGNTIGVTLDVSARTVKSKVANAKKPIDEAIIEVGFGKSSTTIKNMMGLDYEQMRSVAEPDLEQLTLTFISEDLKSSFKIGAMAELLPKALGYRNGQPLVIFMHGFTDDPNLCNFTLVNEAFQSKGYHNILALDASPLIRFLYLRSSTYVRFIGEKLGEALAALVKSGLDRSSIHLVGHSLGSHIAGFAGKAFHSLTGSLVGRISGLDPAGPCFSHLDAPMRLAATDAEFVDVIHTNAGVYGLSAPIGQVDFFPNGGEQQPNCLFEFQSHNRVVELFAESVRNPEAFPSRACSDWSEFVKGECAFDLLDDCDLVYMGYGCKRGTTGQYYLRTGEVQPYGIGKEGLKCSEGIIRRILDELNKELD